MKTHTITRRNAVPPVLVGALALGVLAPSADAEPFAWAAGNGKIVHIEDMTGWFEQTSPTGDNWQDVEFVSPEVGWIVGGSGDHLRTTDGGANWVAGSLDVNNGVFGISAVDENTAWLCTNGALIYKTVDGGVSWFQQANIGGGAFKDVHFVDADHGWAVGNLGFVDGQIPIYATVDGGQNWLLQSSGITQLQALNKIHFVDTNTGWVVGNLGKILHTQDGGATWVQQTSGTGSNLAGVDFVDATTGWAGGGGGNILHTSDGGATWSPQPGIVNQFVNDVAFASENVGWAVTSPGARIYRTVDGGLNWSFQTNSPHNMSAIFALPITGVTGAPGLQLPPSALLRNTPNPFHPSTTIHFELPRATDVTLAVYSVTGQRVARLVEGRRAAGHHEVEWRGRDQSGREVAAGIYFYRLTAGNSVSTAKAVLKR